jgi:signal transduction histidine kinase
MILLDNAVKFTAPGGRVSIDVGGDGGPPAVTVSDTGCGITPEQMPHLFERFWRGDEARARDGAGGAGLGLAIARWIADAHGATIDVASTPGAGTRVTVTFPAPAPV